MKLSVVISALLAVIICIILFWLSTKYEIGLFVSIAGSVASLFGLWLTYRQIKSVKTITEETKTAVDTKIIEINKYLTLADMSRILPLAKEVQTYLLSPLKLELAIVRMRDLKIEIVQLRQNSRVLSEEELSNLSSCINNLGIDIKNISTSIQNKEQLSIEVLVDHIESILTVLADLEGKLKYKEL